MKFAHEFKAALAKEGFPPHWVESAIPYNQLKKCIKKVASELQSLGLDPTTLARLVPPGTSNISEVESDQQGGVAFQYDFRGEDVLQPKLTLFIQLEDGHAVDAGLSTQTREFLKSLVRSQKSRNSSSETLDGTLDEGRKEQQLESPTEIQQDPTAAAAAAAHNPVVQRVEVPLKFDNEFFGILQNDVTILDAIMETEQQVLTREIVALSADIAAITKPSKYSKSDLYRWRELFEIYLEAAPFFSTRECDSGKRNSITAAKKLQWFQSEVTKRGLVSNFKLPASLRVLDRFVALNITLLQNMSYQEINQKAVIKIIKKFDKRTRLGASKAIPKLTQFDSSMSESMAKAVCAQLSTDIVKIVPQIDDYLCPICYSIYWRPVRMNCNHVLCIRCIVMMQRQKKNLCPLCRESVVMQADTDNLDEDLSKFLLKYFAKESRQRQIEVETLYGIEEYGQFYKHPSESKCLIM